MTAGLLVFRAWCSGRRVALTAGMVATVSFVLLPLPPGALLRIALWPAPGLDLFLISLTAGCAVCLGTVALVPLAPEWEHLRRARVRVAHAGTWFCVCVLLPGIAPLVTAVRLRHHLVTASALVGTHLAIAGICGLAVGFLGRALGSLVALAVLAGVALVDQAQGLHWVWANTRGPGDLVLPCCLLLAGLAAQGMSGGVPGWVERRGPAPE